MNRRSQKKQQKRQAEAFAQLEALSRQGKDDELLARAAELGADLAVSPFAARWAEVADRAVRQGLAQADFSRLDRLLRALRRNGPLRPLALLAKAVLDLAAGRLGEARAALTALANLTSGAGAVPGMPAGLLAELQNLAGDGPDPRRDPYLRAASGLFAALQALAAQGFAPTPAERKALARRLRTLGDLAPEGPEVQGLSDAAGRCLALLAELAELETGLSRVPEEDKTGMRRALVAWLRRTGPALWAALGAPGPPLLAPLRHAVGLRWRSVLARLEAREGGAGLAALWGVDPKLLSHHLDLPQGGVQERLRQRAQAEQLLEQGRHAKLAELLRSRSRAAADTADLAVLWSLELWARGRMEEVEEVEDEELWLGSEPYPHRTLVRLGEMAGEIGRRFPAEPRAGVARVLAGELFALPARTGFCDHTAGAALALLEHRPGEVGPAGRPADLVVGLLLAGIAGAVASDVPRLLRTLLDHLDRIGHGNAGASPIVERLLAQIAREDPRVLTRILKAVRALFADDAWPGLAELVAREMGSGFAELLNETSFLAPEDKARVLAGLRGELDLLRPALEGTLGFAAVELVVHDWPLGVTPRLPRFLAAFPGWEGPAAALRVLAKILGPWSPASVERAAGRLARTAIDRLDDRWRVWSPGIPTLAMAADTGDLERLETRVRQLLDSPGVTGEGRTSLEAGLQTIQEIALFRRGVGRPPRKRAKQRRKSKPRRRSGRAPQLRLDFP